ncbi:YbaB/EbfC family nucleoid-associated protein [candidate division WWE3 bacterium]|uniref:YbaB/EbfC family nucleoid-associated protein n=1 Tax=candidate division WWE3 bacterium TaxID=2053526 RepID=A0A955LKF2_UNCKA|nr:YbaB/EbfC family nucleoid-associated protein [candidate division WWE3 bacterium]
MLDKVKELNEFRKKAKQMESELSAEVIEVSYKGVVVKVSANIDIVEIISNDRSDSDITDAVNKAVKEAQKIAAKKMRGQLGDLGLNLPGM